MKTGTKIFIGAALFIGGLIALGYKKVSQLQQQLYTIAIAPFAVKNVKIGLKQISFDLDVIVKNNSAMEFYVTGAVIATLSRLEIVYKGKVIGTAQTNLDEVSIPAYGQTILKNIPVVIPTSELVNNITNISDVLQKFTIIGYVDVLGVEYQIGA